MNENERQLLNKDIHDYSDIYDLPHHVSKRHPQMPLYDRAAQFSPFAPLVKHFEADGDEEKSDVSGNGFSNLPDTPDF